LSDVNVTNSNSLAALNKKGIIALVTTGNAMVSLSGVLFDNIQLDNAANGSFSLSGQAQSLSIADSTFQSIKTGNAGGAIYLSVSFVSGFSADTFIENSVCVFFIGVKNLIFFFFLFIFFFFSRHLVSAKRNGVVRFVFHNSRFDWKI
jgi:hypothetical protein